jgi:hypothetical protein
MYKWNHHNDGWKKKRKPIFNHFDVKKIYPAQKKKKK